MSNVWLTKRSNGVWYARFRRAGREVWRSLKTKERAQARRLGAALEKVLEEGGVELPERLDAPAAWRRYMALHGGHVSGSTQATRAQAWALFWKWAPVTMLEGVTPGMVAEWQASLGKEYKASTVNVFMSALGAIWNVLLRAEEIEGRNPVGRVRALRVSRRQPRFLSEVEVERLLEAAAEEEEALLFVALGVFAGLRRREIVAARWGWIHWPAAGSTGHILVPAMEGEDFEAKGRRAHAVPLMGRLQAILAGRRGLDQAYILAPFAQSRYLDRFVRPMQAAAGRAGLEGVTPHVLRHTFASMAVQQGVGLYKVSQWLGHADLKTTQIYAHLRVDDADIDRVYGGAAEG